MTWTELRREIFIQFSLASSSKGATSVDSVDLSFNYKTQTLDQLWTQIRVHVRGKAFWKNQEVYAANFLK